MAGFCGWSVACSRPGIWRIGGGNATLSGAPQGGVASPVLSNIYLDRLDQFVEQRLLPEYNRVGFQNSAVTADLWLSGSAFVLVDQSAQDRPALDRLAVGEGGMIRSWRDKS